MKAPFCSFWFWISITCFMGLVSHGIWDHWEIPFYGEPKKFAEINALVYGMMDLPIFFSNCVCFFVLLANVSLYRRCRANQTPWKGLLQSGIQGMFFMLLAQVGIVLLFTLLSGRFFSFVPTTIYLYQNVFTGQNVMTTSWFMGVGGILLDSLGGSICCSMLGYAVCRFLSHTEEIFGYMALLYHVPIVTTLLQSTLRVWIGVAVFGLHADLSMRINSLLFLCACTVLLMLLADYLKRRRSRGNQSLEEPQE